MDGHSERFTLLSLNTARRGSLEKPDGHGRRAGVCGDTIEIFIKVVNDQIQQVAFETDGCINTNACCNAVVLLTEGRSVEDAWKLTPEKVAGFLETLPADHFHCAELAVGALYLALSDYRRFQQEPWKRVYAVGK
jgi:nitrogen fixation protein NifU and related proteins